MTKERFDIHQHITDKIVNAIERSAGDFRLPWHRAFRKPSVSSPRCGTLNRPMAASRTTTRIGPLGLPQPRQEIAAIPDQ